MTNRFRDEQNAVRKALRHLEIASGKTFEGLDTTAIPEKPRRPRKPSTEPNEHAIQRAVVSWWARQCKAYNLPAFALFSVPNGMYLANPNMISKYKSEGLRNGVPDLLLDVARGPYHGLRLETKSRTGRLSDEQSAYRDYYLRAGYQWVLYRTPDDGIETIRSYLNGGI